MRHNYAGRKLGRTASHKRALLTNLATSLFEHKRVVTTVAKAKELRPFAEHLITRARNAYKAEKAGTISGVDVHSRRMVGRFIRNKAVLQELFDTIAPLVAERNGGYTRITKLGLRRGDNAPEAIIELVDWSNPQDGRVSAKTRKETKVAKPKPRATPKVSKPVAELVDEPVVESVVEQVDELVSASVSEAPVAEAPASEAPADDAPAADAGETEEKA